MKNNKTSPENTHRVYYFSKKDAESTIKESLKRGVAMDLKYCDTESGERIFTRCCDIAINLLGEAKENPTNNERLVAITPIKEISENIEVRSPQYCEQMISDEEQEMENYAGPQMY